MKHLIDTGYKGYYSDSLKEFLNEYLFTATGGWASFVKYDTAGDIDREEFRRIAQEASREAEKNDFFNKVDLDSNGGISAHELKHVIDTEAPKEERDFYNNYLFDIEPAWKKDIHHDADGEINQKELNRLVKKVSDASRARQ